VPAIAKSDRLHLAERSRKVWGGNRTWPGAKTQAILMSVINTLQLRNTDPIDWLRRKQLQPNLRLTA
jgi:hypothetical protein